METILSNVLCEKLFETMGALTMALKTHLRQVDERTAAVDDKCEHLKQSMEELSQRHGESSDEIRKTLDSVTESLRDTGMGLQRVLDKQELVDAHVLLSKLGKEASDAKKETNKAPKPDLITMKSKNVTDSGGPSEPQHWHQSKLQLLPCLQQRLSLSLQPHPLLWPYLWLRLPQHPFRTILCTHTILHPLLQRLLLHLLLHLLSPLHPLQLDLPLLSLHR